MCSHHCIGVLVVVREADGLGECFAHIRVLIGQLGACLNHAFETMMEANLLKLLRGDCIHGAVTAVVLCCNKKDKCVGVDRLDLGLKLIDALQGFSRVDGDAEHEAVSVRVYELPMTAKLRVSIRVDDLDVDRSSIKFELTSK